MNNDNNLKSGPDKAPDVILAPSQADLTRMLDHGVLMVEDIPSWRAMIQRDMQARPDYPEKLIQAFIGEATLEGIITEGQHSTLMEFLLESYLEAL